MRTLLLITIAILLVAAAVFFREVRLMLLCVGAALVWWKGMRSIAEDYQRTYEAWQIAQIRLHQKHPRLARMGFGYDRPRSYLDMMWTLLVVFFVLVGFILLA